MSKHTPGPWQVDGIYIGDSKRVIIGQVGRHGGAENEANARLIAASPDLLAAAIAAESWLSEYEQGPDSGLHGLLAQLRAAIAKAEGVQS